MARLGSVFTIVTVALAASLPVEAQQGGSLADAARQARAQKQSQPQAEVNQAQQIADELSEDQNGKAAPGGFKTYNAGGFQLVIPAPYSTTGQDSGGTVLSGPRVGTVVPMVLVGNSIVLQAENSEDAFRDAATQFARGYAQSANCTKTTVASHSAYQCGLAGANLLGRSVSGNAVLMKASGNMYPLLCVATTDSRAHEMLNSAHSTALQKIHARQTLAQEDEYAREVWQKCETVFASVRVKENAGPPENVAQSSNSGTAAAQAESPKTVTAQSTAAAAVTASTPSALTQSTVPAGSKVHSFTYCQSHNQCWDASVLVPSDAKLISSDCNQYVFEINVQGEPFLLLTGSAAGEGCNGRKADDPGLVRWQQLVAPESQRAPGTSSTISDQQMTLDGKRAVMTKIKFRKGLTSWIGKRAEIVTNGIPLVVGCMAQDGHFSDGDDICTNVIGSLRLP